MKKALAVTLTAVLVGGLFSYAAAHQSQGRGWGRGHGPGSCPEDGRGSCLDSDARGKGDFRGQGFGPGNCRNTTGDSFGQVEDAEAATALVESLLARRQNPNLQVGKVTEAGRDFEVEIVTKDGSLANKLFVEKRSGRIIPAYR